jgi:hypothetical protein
MFRLNSYILVSVSMVCVGALVIPTNLGVALIGQIWPLAQPLLLPVAVDRLVGAAGVAPSAALRAIGNTASLAKIRATASITILVAVVPGLVLGDTAMCAWGLVLGSAVSTGGNWIASQRHMRVATDTVS